MSDYDHNARPELTMTIPSDPRVPQLPQGECVIWSLYDPVHGTQLHIRSASSYSTRYAPTRRTASPST